MENRLYWRLPETEPGTPPRVCPGIPPLAVYLRLCMWYPGGRTADEKETSMTD